MKHLKDELDKVPTLKSELNIKEEHVEKLKKEILELRKENKQLKEEKEVIISLRVIYAYTFLCIIVVAVYGLIL